MNNIKDFINYNKSNIIIGALILLIIIFGFLIGQNIINNNSNNNHNTVEKKLYLFGSDSITLKYNENYQEPGFYATNEKGEIDTNKVIVKEDIDIEKPGTYIITYQYDNIIKTRTIIVLDKEETNDDDNDDEKLDENLLTISLKGEQTVNLYTSDKYQEPGYIAKYNDIDLTNDVKVSSNYVEGQVGTYLVTYTIKYQELEKQITRTVNVINNKLDLAISFSATTYTKSPIKVTTTVSGNDFWYLLLPDGSKSQNKTTTYTITKNGTYKFTAYNKSNQAFTKNVTIKNIDTESPTGTCEATINTNNTVIKVNAKDNLSGIKNYIYKDSNNIINTSTTNTYTYNKKTSKKVYVQVNDKVGNSTTLTCKITDNSYLPVIKPSSNETIVKQEETDTLKVYITKTSTYYLTRVWMMDPYNQLNKEDSPEYGKNLYRPKKLLQNAINNNNLQNKLVVGFNASGFYLKDHYDKASVNKYPKYDKTSVGTLVITNGKVIRNLYDKGDLLTWFISGVTPNNKLVVYEDIKMKETSVSEKKTWSEKVINSGIRNTYTFAAPVILNGKKTNYTNKNSRMPGSNTENKGLQLLCQINDNNFALFTAKSEKRNTAINLFMKLGCQTAVNLDGGGSVALLYKSSKSNNVEVLIGNGRDLPEVGYFSES